jgi:hypothetical protein
VVCSAQHFVRKHYNASAVSQRDLKRVFKFVDYFHNHAFHHEDPHGAIIKRTRGLALHSVILAIAMVR